VPAEVAKRIDNPDVWVDDEQRDSDEQAAEQAGEQSPEPGPTSQSIRQGRR
jgi:hypothetical protein